jgi:hypothetical protein
VLFIKVVNKIRQQSNNEDVDLFLTDLSSQAAIHKLAVGFRTGSSVDWTFHLNACRFSPVKRILTPFNGIERASII